jgi:integrase
MASVANDPGGRKRIIFLDKNKNRKAIWLGKVSRRLADEIKTKVEAIVTAAIAARSIDSETAEWLDKVLEACPDVEWRLIFALSRFGGLRCPSEHLILSWADLDWERSRFRVESPKTGVRWVPIFPN